MRGLLITLASIALFTAGCATQEQPSVATHHHTVVQKTRKHQQARIHQENKNKLHLYTK